MPVSPVSRGLRSLGLEEAFRSCGDGTQRKVRSTRSCLACVDFSHLDKDTLFGAVGSFPEQVEYRSLPRCA